MKTIALALLLSFAVQAEEPPDAFEFTERRYLVDAENKPHWMADGGLCLTADGQKKLDAEFFRLQQAEPKVSPAAVFLAGAGAGAIVVGLIIGIVVATKVK